MGKKKSESPAKRAAQRQRTRENKRKKYTALLAEFPNSPDAKKWKEKMEKAREEKAR